jgi:hypothetical protein
LYTELSYEKTNPHRFTLPKRCLRIDWVPFVFRWGFLFMKRFTDTCIWTEDWFLDAPIEFKLFWFYVKDICNHAGIWKVNKRQFEFILGSSLSLIDFLKLVNTDKKRIEIVGSGKWYLTGFIHFQYGNILNENNRVHNSILKELTTYNIDNSTFEVKLRSNSGQSDHKEGVKDKDKEKEKENNIKVEFEKFWNEYDKKVGEKTKIFNKWKNLSEPEKLKIFEHIPKYKLSQPDKKYRKNPETYLNNKSWNDEIIENGTSKPDNKTGIRQDLSGSDYSTIV